MEKEKAQKARRLTPKALRRRLMNHLEQVEEGLFQSLKPLLGAGRNPNPALARELRLCIGHLLELLEKEGSKAKGPWGLSLADLERAYRERERLFEEAKVESPFLRERPCFQAETSAKQSQDITQRDDAVTHGNNPSCSNSARMDIGGTTLDIGEGTRVQHLIQREDSV